MKPMTVLEKDNSAPVQKPNQIHGIFKYPVEVLLSITYFIITIAYFNGWHLFGLLSPILSLDSDDPFYAIAGMYLPLLLLAISFNRLGWKWMYVLSYFLWIPILLWGYQMNATKVLSLNILAIILFVLVYRERKDNESFAHSLNVAAEAFCLVGLMVIGLFIIIFVLCDNAEQLFNISILSDVPYILGFCMLPFGTAAFLIIRHYHDEVYEGSGKRMDFVFTPLLLVGTIVLYIYGIRILVKWDLPRGFVAIPVGFYLIFGLFCSVLNETTKRLIFKWFYRWFPIFSLPLLVFLWVGILRRIGDYGLTESRVYLLLTASLLTLFLILSFFEKSRNYSLMSLILAGSIILFTFIPGITAKDIAIYQQEARLQNARSFLKNDEHEQDDPARKEAKFRAEEAYQYLRKEMDSQRFEEKYGDLWLHKDW